MTAKRRRAPTCPYELGAAGTSWWRWAWKTGQSDTWIADGALYTAARRAQLEDELAAHALADTDGLLENLLHGADDDSAAEAVRWALERLARSATGSTGMSREMRELETQLGLGPRALRGLQGKDAKPKPPKGGGLDDLARKRDARRSGT